MNEQNKNRLKVDFPEFNFPSIDVYDGWFDLLRELCANIREELRKNPSEKFKILQIKEKFGGLRFYTIGNNRTIDELIDQTEIKSETICERCGSQTAKNENKTFSGWYKTLCDQCREKLKHGNKKET